MRISPDDREPTEDDTPKATKGKVIWNRNQQNAETWLAEADRHFANAIRYYRAAASWWDKAGMTSERDYYLTLADGLEAFGNG